MLNPDDIIDGRFRVQSVTSTEAYGVHYRCMSITEDTLSDVLIIGLAQLTPEGRKRLAKDISIASRLRHKNIVPSLGYGQTEAGVYVSVKTGQGRTLVEHLERRKKLQKPFERSESFSLLSHICNAIQFSSESLGHGTLRTSSVVINSNGRVQLRHFGLGALRQLVEPESIWDKGCFFQGGGQLDNDLYALGVLTLQLLTGEPIADGLQAGIDIHADEVHPSARQCLMKCLSPSQAGGYLSAAEFRRAVKPVFLKAAAIVDSAKVVEASVTSTVPKDGLSTLEPSRADLSRWLIERDGVDFGPFNQAQILEKLYAGELTPRSVLADVESERRLPLAEYPEYEADMLQSLHKKDERETADRAVRAKKKAKLDKNLKLWGTVGLLLTIIAVVGTWQYIVSNRPEPVRPHLSSAVTTLEWSLPAIPAPEPELPAETAVAKKTKKKAVRRRSTSAKKWSKSEKARMLREEQMAANSDLDGESRSRAPFSRRSFDRVLAQRTPRIYRCLMAEAKARPGVQDMIVKTSVLASGAIVNVRMSGGTVPGVRCIKRAFQGARIPAFSGTNKTISLPYRLN